MKLPALNRQALLQVLIVLAVLLPLVAGGWYIALRHQQAQTTLNDLEPRYARLLGLVERQPELQQLSAQASSQITQLAYPASQDLTQAGNDAQQRIRSLFADSKLEVASIQVLPPGKEEGPFDRIQISLRVEGELVGIQNALSILATQSPRVVVDTMALQTIGAVKPASIQRLGGEFSFSVWRVRS
jgi:general secretion pathway protein M